jgi:hypothetical protein
MFLPSDVQPNKKNKEKGCLTYNQIVGYDFHLEACISQHSVACLSMQFTTATTTITVAAATTITTATTTTFCLKICVDHQLMHGTATPFSCRFWLFFSLFRLCIQFSLDSFICIVLTAVVVMTNFHLTGTAIIKF